MRRIARDVLRGQAQNWFDPLPAIEQVTSLAVTTYYFGEDAEGVRCHVARLLDELSKVIGNPFSLPASVWTRRRARIRRRHERARTAILLQLHRRVSDPTAYSDAATALLQSSQRRHPEPLERLADLLVGALMAGYRVPAAGIAWTLILLANDGDAQRIANREIWSESEQPANRRRREFTFLDACVMEAV